MNVENKQIKHETQTVGYRAFYLERSGESAQSMVNILMEAPDFPLSPEDHAKVLDFEKGLYGTYITREDTVESVLRDTLDESESAPFFFAEAFRSGYVTTDGLSNTVELPAFSSHTDVYTWLARAVHSGSVAPADLRVLAAQSETYYKEIVTPALVEDKYIPPAATEAMAIVLEPNKLAKTIQSTAELRKYLLELRSLTREDGQRVDEAKRAIVDVYLGKTDDQIAGHIAVADYLLEQSKLLGNQVSTAMALSLIPEGLREAVQHTETKERLFRRLDYLRNGMALNNGVASAVSDRLMAQTETAQGIGEYSDVERKKFEETMLQPEEMRAIFEEILARAEVLSSEESTTWNPTRKHRAADGLYQVVENPGKDTFAVDSISGAYKVPKVPRSLYSVMVVGGSHELAHVDQAEADRTVAATLRIATLKGRRVSGLREAGANMRQRQAELEWFGQSKPVALTYAKALAAIGDGGGIAEAARAFYDESVRLRPEASPKDAAAVASDRVLRIVRKGGTSSQPMVYAEESILVDELKDASPEAIARATAITSFDLQDQVRLHKHGLLPEPDYQSRDWSQIVHEVLKPYIQRALAA